MTHVSQKGYVLVEVLASLLIITIGMSALFISTSYANAKAEENYHYRVAILRAQSALDKVTYFNKKTGGGFISVNESVELDPRDGHKLFGRILSDKLITNSDIAAGLGVSRHKYTIKVLWSEPIISWDSKYSKKKEQTLLLEEYYYSRASN